MSTPQKRLIQNILKAMEMAERESGRERIKRGTREGLKDYEAAWNAVWEEICVDADGDLNLDQIKRELYDYWMIIEDLPMLYDDLTNGRLSKPNTAAHHVVNAVNERIDEALKEQAKEIFQMLRMAEEYTAAEEVENYMRDLPS